MCSSFHSVTAEYMPVCRKKKLQEKIVVGRIAQLSITHFSKIILMRLFLKKQSKK